MYQQFADEGMQEQDFIQQQRQQFRGGPGQSQGVPVYDVNM